MSAEPARWIPADAVVPDPTDPAAAVPLFASGRRRVLRRAAARVLFGVAALALIAGLVAGRTAHRHGAADAVGPVHQARPGRIAAEMTAGARATRHRTASHERTRHRATRHHTASRHRATRHHTASHRARGHRTARRHRRVAAPGPSASPPVTARPAAPLPAPAHPARPVLTSNPAPRATPVPRSRESSTPPAPKPPPSTDARGRTPPAP